MSLKSKVRLYDWLWICCELVVRFFLLIDLLTNISTILTTHRDIFDVLAACTINVASAAAMLHLQTAATVQARMQNQILKTSLAVALTSVKNK